MNGFCEMQDCERSKSMRPGKTQRDHQDKNVSDSMLVQLPSTTTHCQISHPTNTIRFLSWHDHSSVFPSLCQTMQVTRLYVWVTLINCFTFSWIGSRISCHCSKITYWHGSWAISTMIRLLLIRIVRPFDFNMITFTSIKHFISTTQATTCAIYKRPWTLTQSTATSWSLQMKNQEWMLTHIGMHTSSEFFHVNIFHIGPDLSTSSNKSWKMDVLWVCWFGHDANYQSGFKACHLPWIGFFDGNEDCTFGQRLDFWTQIKLFEQLTSCLHSRKGVLKNFWVLW